MTHTHRPGNIRRAIHTGTRMKKPNKRPLKLHKVKRPKKLRPFVGDCPFEPAPAMAVVRAKPLIDEHAWDVFRRRNWVVRQWNTAIPGQHFWVYARTNVPVCCELAVPIRLLPYCGRVEAGWEVGGDWSGEPARCEPYTDPTLSVTERLSRFGTGQRPAFPDAELCLMSAQTFGTGDVRPSDFTS